MTNSDSIDHDRIMRIIMARCGDVLTAADIAALAGPRTMPDIPVDIPIDIAVIDLIIALEERIARLEHAVQGDTPRDDRRRLQ